LLLKVCDRANPVKRLLLGQAFLLMLTQAKKPLLSRRCSIHRPGFSGFLDHEFGVFPQPRGFQPGEAEPIKIFAGRDRTGLEER
jgi:hypothetical protein